MASRLLARSGIAVGLVADVLGWRADSVCQVGVGQFNKEIEVLSSEWPGVKWVGFEPHPDVYTQLRPIYPGLLYNMALGSKPGMAFLNAKKRHPDGSSLHPFQDQAIHRYSVDVGTLDGFINTLDWGKLLLWLDCEGSELDVLEGGEDFLALVDVVNVEMTGKPPGDGWCRPTEVHQFLVDHGFLAQWCHTQRVSAGQSDFIYVRPELFKPEFCCFPWEVVRYESM